MDKFAPNTNLPDARRFRAVVLLAMSVLLLTSFGLMAAGVDDHKLFARWDADGKDVLHEHALGHEAPRTAFRIVTELGNTRGLAAAAVVVLVVLAALRLWQLGAIWAVTTLGGMKVVQVLKHLYQRERPAFLEPIVIEDTFSFPSGHASSAALFYGMLAYLIIRATRRVGWFAAPLLGVLVALIAFSRVYLGAHWFSDVLGGMVFGLGWVCLGMAAAEITREY